MPSAALQSPFSWMWKPCLPAGTPVSRATNRTSLPGCENETVPLAVLPAVGAIWATAPGPAVFIEAHADNRAATAITGRERNMSSPGGRLDRDGSDPKGAHDRPSTDRLSRQGKRFRL